MPSEEVVPKISVPVTALTEDGRSLNSITILIRDLEVLIQQYKIHFHLIQSWRKQDFFQPEFPILLFVSTVGCA